MANRTVTVTLVAKPTGLVAGLQTAKKSVKDFGAEVDTLSAKQGGKFNSLTNKAAIFGAGLTLAFGAAVKAAYEFDKQMSAVGAVAEANAKQLDQLRQAALQAGKDTAYTATQAAQGEEELAKAGVSVTDIINGGLKGALSLAAAGSLDLATASTVAAQAMNQFALGGKSVSHIADVLTAGANKSATDVQALGESLGQVGGVAHQAGLSLDETVGVLAMFAQQGMIGEEAGTAFKTMLLKLENPTSKAADLMQSLGLQVYDQSGNFLSAAQLAGQLQKALGGLTNEQRNAALGTIFGTRAVRGAVALYQAGTAGVQKWTNAVNDTGIAAETAAKKQDNLAGDLKKLKGSLDVLAIQSSGGATKGLRTLTEGATALTNVIAGMPTPITSTLTVLTGVVGVTSLAGAGFAKARGSVQNFMSTLRDMGPTGAKAAGALGKIGKAAGGLAIAGVVIGGVIEGFQALDSWLKRREHPTAAQIDDLSRSLQGFAQSASVSGELAKRFGSDLGKLGHDVAAVTAVNVQLAKLNALMNAPKGPGGGRIDQGLNFQRAQATQGILNQKKAIEELDGALTQMVQNGGASQAAIALANLEHQAGLSDAQIAALNALLPNYTKAAGDAATANSGLSQGFGSTAANAQTMAHSWQDAIEKGQTLLDVFKQLNGAVTDTKSSHIDFEQSLADLTKAFSKETGAQLRSKKAWDDTTQAGRDNTKMVLDSIDKAAKHSQAVLDQTGSVDQASAAWYRDVDALKAVLLKAGLTDAQINDLINTYAKMPPAVSTTINTPGMAQAIYDAGHLAAIVRNLPGGKTIRISIKTDGHGSTGSWAINRYGGVYEHAATGLLNEATTYSATSPGRYMIAEPQTGGEAFIPKRGDYGRSMSILNQAAAWYGAQVVAQSQPTASPSRGGGVTVENLNIRAYSERFNLQQVQRDLALYGVH